MQGAPHFPREGKYQKLILKIVYFSVLLLLYEKGSGDEWNNSKPPFVALRMTKRNYFSSTIFRVCRKPSASMEYKYIPAETGSALEFVPFQIID
jgi:hypothetical protein